MPIENPPIAQIIDIPSHHRRKDHEPPVQAQTVHAERVSNEGGEDAEEGAVAEPGEGGEEEEVGGVGYQEGGELGEGEDQGGGEEAPEAGGVEAFYEEVGADAWGGSV